MLIPRLQTFIFVVSRLFYSWAAFVGKYLQDYFSCFEMQVCVFHNFLNSIVENRIFLCVKIVKSLLTPLVYEKTVVVQRVRYSKKLAEKCSAALKSVMFMNDFDNFKENCTG